VKLIVGLGNPGQKYEWTRHNAGFLVLDRLAEKLGAEFGRKRFEAQVAETRYEGEPLVLLKPQTFMNLSGRSVGSAVTFFKTPPAEVLVIHDELDLPFGVVRFKQGGGSAGHNGLKSITQQMGAEYVRLRVGIGKPPPPQETVSYVLAPYSQEERQCLDKQLDECVEGALLWVSRGLQWAMNETHRKNQV
jgi:PTH1 family peptidyl-tRNA hydrolase